MPSPDTVRRLAFIRLLLQSAEEASRQAPPFSTDSINRFHDVAEMFLALAVEVHSGRIPDAGFMAYWNEIEQLTTRPLGYRAAMQRVNKTRVNLKHYGIQPAATEVDHCASTVRNLLIDSCQDLFDIELESISLAMFVKSDTGMRCLEAAERHWADDEKAEAFADLREAFDEIVGGYIKTKKHRRRSPLANDRRYRIPDAAERRYRDAVRDDLDDLGYRQTLIDLGVDLRRAARFNTLTPQVSSMTAGNQRSYRVPSNWDPSEDDYLFCRDFVIATSLRLSEFDNDRAHEQTEPASSKSRTIRRTRSAAAPPETDG